MLPIYIKSNSILDMMYITLPNVYSCCTFSSFFFTWCECYKYFASNWIVTSLFKAFLLIAWCVNLTCFSDKNFRKLLQFGSFVTGVIGIIISDSDAAHNICCNKCSFRFGNLVAYLNFNMILMYDISFVFASKLLMLYKIVV